jgi:hypothetical protein
MGTSKTQVEPTASQATPSTTAEKQTSAPEQNIGPVRDHRATASTSPRNGSPPDARIGGNLISPEEFSQASKRAQMSTAIQCQLGNTRAGSLLVGPQARVAVGAPGDRYEQEAEEIASRVVSGQKVGRISRITTGYIASHVRGQLEGKNALQAFPVQPLSEKDDGVGEVGDAAAEARIKSPGSGRPLPDGIRSEMESGLGADFSAVRIHDTAADQADAGNLNAKAFAYRNHIWLGPGASAGDRKLMAHELTHVVQQGAGMRRNLDRMPEQQRGEDSTPESVREHRIQTKCSSSGAGKPIKPLAYPQGEMPIQRTPATLQTQLEQMGLTAAEAVALVAFHPDNGGAINYSERQLRRIGSHVHRNANITGVQTATLINVFTAAPLSASQVISLIGMRRHFPYADVLLLANQIVAIGIPAGRALRITNRLKSRLTAADISILFPLFNNYRDSHIIRIGRSVAGNVNITCAEALTLINFFAPPLPVAHVITLIGLTRHFPFADVHLLAIHIVTTGIPADRALRITNRLRSRLTLAEIQTLFPLFNNYSDRNIARIGRSVAGHAITAARYVAIINHINTGVLAIGELIRLVEGLSGTYNDVDLGILGNALVAGLHRVGGRKTARHMVALAQINTPAAIGIAMFMQSPNPVTAIHVPTDNYGGHSPDHLGPGEETAVTAMIAGGLLTSADIGGVTWVRGNSQTQVANVNAAAGTADVTAPDSRHRSTLVRVRGNARPYLRATLGELRLPTVPPTGANIVQTGNIRHTQGMLGVGFQGNPHITATHAVSFGNIEIKEDPRRGARGIVTGVMRGHSQVHNPGPNWFRMPMGGNPAVAPGAPDGTTDTIDTGDIAPATLSWNRYANGTFTWNIRWGYRVVGSTRIHVFTTVVHAETYTRDPGFPAASNHTASIGKGGAGPFARNVNDPTSVF